MELGEGCGEPQEAPCQLSRGRHGPDDPLSTTFPDEAHSQEEVRLVTIGASTLGKVLVVAHIERNDTVRIISARRATRREREFYEQGKSTGR
jgi:uncharacterized DUF497 family protein